jgi:hypothetical protein
MEEQKTTITPINEKPADNGTTPPPIEVTGEGIQLSTGAKIGIVLGIIVAIIVSILIFSFLVSNPSTTETFRDIAIIALAFESLVILTLLAVLIYQLIILIAMLRDDVKPMLESTQETLNTLRGTATFVSERVTKPAIQASGYISGIGRSMSVLFALRPRRRSGNPAARASSGPIENSSGSAVGPTGGSAATQSQVGGIGEEK